MNILLALDCTPGSEDMVGEVLEQPWPRGARFTVLHVRDQAGREEYEERCLHAAVFAISERGWQATRHLLEGSPKQQILDYAEQHSPDLILVGDRRRSNVSRFVLGSVSTSVMRHAKCSVQIVRPRVRDFRAERAMRVMLATDGSTQASKAAEAVARRPWRPGTEARVVSVVELILPPTVSLIEPCEPGFPPHPDDFAEAKRLARCSASRAAQIIGSACSHVSESIPVVASGAKNAIIEEAKGWDADCIFLGSHGVHGLDRFLLGSVSEAVAVHAHCSVEVVR